MEKVYLVVINVNNELYVQLTEVDGRHKLTAFLSKDEALSQFDDFRKKAISSDYENHISGSVGIINIYPHIIEMDKDKPESIGEYILNMKPFELKGSVFGAFINMSGVLVTEEILKLSVCNVAKEYIDEVYSR